MSEEYDNRGQVALWKPKSDNPKAPAARGTVTAHRDIKEGEEVEIALWRFQSDNPKAPLMKGRLSDKRQQGQENPEREHPERETTPQSTDFDDDIPF